LFAGATWQAGLHKAVIVVGLIIEFEQAEAIVGTRLA